MTTTSEMWIAVTTTQYIVTHEPSVSSTIHSSTTSFIPTTTVEHSLTGNCVITLHANYIFVCS